MQGRSFLLLSALTITGCPLLIDDELEVVDAVAGAADDDARPSGGGAPPANVPDTPTGDAGMPPLGPAVCESVTPPAGVACPAACDRCEGSVCVLDCGADDACKDNAVSCPEGVGCRIDCGGRAGCAGTTITCARDYACELLCTAEDACNDAVLMCGEGGCSVTCGLPTKACEKLNVTCGGAPCEAECLGLGARPLLDCGNSCGCRACL